MRSIFETPAPQKATREGPAVTPMSGPQQPVIQPDPPGNIRHVPNSDQRSGGR
jgi:hypothetical protein